MTELNQTPPPQYIDQMEDEIDLMDLFHTLFDKKWFILIITILAGIGGFFYAWSSTPIYHADALLQVEEKSSGIPGLADMSELLTTDASAVTEIEIIRSRTIIGQAVKQRQLDIYANPHYFPRIGKSWARSNNGNGLSTIPFSNTPWINTLLKKYAWGGEHINVSRLDMAPELIGKPLLLIVGNNSTFKVLEKKTKQFVLAGKPNQKAVSKDGRSEIFITKLIARPGTEFILGRNSFNSTVKHLQGKINISEKGKRSGILELSLEGPEKQCITKTLDAIANAYLIQNVDRLSKEAEKSLDFLQGQLPIVKSNLESAESKLNDYRLSRESVDITLETQSILDRVVDLENNLAELEMKKVELERLYTSKHPAIISLFKQEEKVKQQKNKLSNIIKSLPETQQEVLRFSRDVKVNTVIFTQLLNKIQELKVVRAGTVGNVRVLDYAVPLAGAVEPKKMMIFLLSIILGLFVGIGLVFIKKALHRAVDQPDQIEEKLGISVYAAVNYSDKQEQIEKNLAKSKSKSKSMLLALQAPKDGAIESLRSLRTNLHFALMEAENNIVMITGPSPEIGKTFISVNFGLVLADAGSKVLLIDADMRKGYMNHYFALDRSPGLSELIAVEATKEDAIRKTAVENMDILLTGSMPPNPSELLMHENFSNILKELSKEYDLILIDTPPILAVTDPSIIGQIAGTTFMVLRSGIHPMKEIEVSIKRLNQNGIDIKGAIFNAVPQTRRYGYGKYGYGKYGYYNYEYK